jgi:hypothetical protein
MQTARRREKILGLLFSEYDKISRMPAVSLIKTPENERKGS